VQVRRVLNYEGQVEWLTGAEDGNRVARLETGEVKTGPSCWPDIGEENKVKRLFLGELRGNRDKRFVCERTASKFGFIMLILSEQ
jgi:hypothetical protein